MTDDVPPPASPDLMAYKAALPLQPFFAVSVSKLIVMSIFTFGFYDFYWFYKNWDALRQRGENVTPFLRAFFHTFTSFWLFKHIRAQAETISPSAKLPAGPLAVAWLIASGLWGLPSIWGLVGGMAGFFVLVPVQSMVNWINTEIDPNHDRNATYSGWNIAAIIMGGCLVALVIVGLLLDDPSTSDVMEPSA